MLSRYMHRLASVCGGVAALAVILLALLVATSIGSRLVGVYVGGLTEGAGYCMAAAGSFGLAHTFLRGEHIRVDLLLGMLPHRIRLRVEQGAVMLSAAISAYLAGYLSRMVVVSWQFGAVSDGSDALPLWIPQLPVALGFDIFAFVVVFAAIESLVRGKHPVGERSSGLLDTEE